MSDKDKIDIISGKIGGAGGRTAHFIQFFENILKSPDKEPDDEKITQDSAP